MFKLIETRKSENNYTTGVPDIIAHFECDTESDLPAQNQTDYTLQLGSTAHVVETNSDFEMKSSGEWRLQRSNGYYTSEEIDTLLSEQYTDIFGNNPDTQLQEGDDLNDILQAGSYTAGSNSIAQNVANSPWTSTRYKFVNLVITGSTPANLRAVQFVFPNLYANQNPVFYFRYRHNATFTSWTSVTGVPV